MNNVLGYTDTEAKGNQSDAMCHLASSQKKNLIAHIADCQLNIIIYERGPNVPSLPTIVEDFYAIELTVFEQNN